MELDFISVKVKDMERAVKFYNELLDKEPKHRNNRLAMYEYGELSFSLYNPEADGISSKHTRFGNNCIPAFRVDDLENEEERVKELTEIEGSYELEDHAGLLIRDTEGNIIELYEWYGGE